MFNAWPQPQVDPGPAVRQYFDLLRSYHILTTKPLQVFEWERLSQYWGVLASLPGQSQPLLSASRIAPPLQTAINPSGFTFLDPSNHEGVDLYTSQSPINLIADGQCLYVGETANDHQGRLAVFRHILPEGGEVLSIYSRLKNTTLANPGRLYSIQTALGELAEDDVLHFAVAYGATWNPESWACRRRCR